MRRALFNLVAAFIIIAVVPTLGSVGYYHYRYLNHEADIERLIEQAAPAHRQYPKALLDLAIITLGHDRLYNDVAKHLTRKFQLNWRFLFWEIDNLAWEQLLQLHYPSKQMMVLWCEYLTIDTVQGCQQIARQRFNKNLSELNDIQLATMVLLSRRPIYYRQNPDALREQIPSLLETYHAI